MYEPNVISSQSYQIRFAYYFQSVHLVHLAIMFNKNKSMKTLKSDLHHIYP